MPAPTLTIETAWILQPSGRQSAVVALIGPPGPMGPSTEAAALSAAEAAASALDAQASATAAAASEAGVAADASAADASATAAAGSASTASTKAGEASDSADAAAASALAAAGSESAAASSAGSAFGSAATATTKAGEASDSAAAAAGSAAAASDSEDAAALSAATATTKAGEALDSANSASASGVIATAKAAEAATKAGEASDSAATANTKAGEAAGSAASALAIYGSVDAQQAAVATAQAQASLAAGYAASAASVAQQDLSAVIAQALHRSPNAITAMHIYDTSKDSDGGAWTERCQHTSWWNEAINGKWLGVHRAETNARYEGAALGAELVPNGTFDAGITGWRDTTTYAGSTVSWDSGTIKLTVGPSVSYCDTAISPSLTVVIGKVYRVSVTITSAVGGAGIVYIGNSTSNVAYVNSSGLSVGTHNFYITATNTELRLILLGYLANAQIKFDNISVREVVAITTQTGDYFQLSTDGKFYRLNAGSGTTEVFRGNKRDFPRLAGIVAEAGNVTIYDLTEPGRPMWGRWTASAFGNVASVAAAQGRVMAGCANGLVTLDHTGDDGRFQQSGNDRTFALTGRSAQSLISRQPQVYIANNVCNAVAMTVLPDAPVDPVTGLRVPTIAVATGGGVSVIKHNGTVVNSAINTTFDQVVLRPEFLSASRNDRGWWYSAANPGALGASFALTSRTVDQAPGFGIGNTGKLVDMGRSRLLRRSSVAARAQMARAHESDPARSLIATVADTFNTGWMTGDIRRCFLSDTKVGSLTAVSLSFTSADASWTNNGDGSFTSNGESGNIKFNVPVGAVAGDAFRVRFNVLSATGGIYLSVSTLLNSPNVLSVGEKEIIGNWSGSYGQIWINSLSFVGTIANITVETAEPDRSYKGRSASITGTITRSQLANGTSLVGYSGFSAANYIRENFSADLDFGTGEWTASAWVNVPAAMADSSFPAVGSDLNGLNWSAPVGGISYAAGAFTFDGVASTNNGTYSTLTPTTSVVAGRTYRVSYRITNKTEANAVRMTLGGVLGRDRTANGTYVEYITATSAAAPTFSGANYIAVRTGTVDNISIIEVGAASLFDRAAASGPRLRLGVTGTGQLTAEAFDGTTTRTVTTSASYNTAQWLKARVNYTTDGTLSILVNGREVAATRGAPLLTLNNASAVLTIGNSFALDAPFPGSIALLKLGATVPTPEQATFMFEQEKQLFRAGALSVLPDSGALVDMAYDDATDRWVAVSAANESYWTGLVRNSVQAVPAGSFTRVAAGSGVELAARSTTNQGVDVTIPAYGLREELVRRAEAAARLSKELAVYDFVGGFTANTTNGSAAITSAAGLTYPGSLIGARVSGSGIPANTQIVGVSGTTIYLSAAATATATGVSISFLDFKLPVGLEAKAVLVAGAAKQEGSTKDYTRLFDGFLETVRFAVAPGATAWVQIQATKGTVQ